MAKVTFTNGSSMELPEGNNPEAGRELRPFEPHPSQEDEINAYLIKGRMNSSQAFQNHILDFAFDVPEEFKNDLKYSIRFVTNQDNDIVRSPFITSAINRFLEDLYVTDRRAFLFVEYPAKLFIKTATIELTQMNSSNLRRLQDLIIGFNHIEGLDFLYDGRTMDIPDIRRLKNN